MPNCRRERAARRALAALGLAPALLCGCGVIGPSVIRYGRGAYNEALARTDNEQILMAIVHARYGEVGSLLAVASITANLTVGASAGTQVGIGADESYAGNIVPFSAGAVYEENPTISYTPVQGERYLRELMAPISLELVAHIVRSLEARGAAFRLLVSRVNDLTNPDFLASPESQPDPRFDRLVALLVALDQAGVAFWADDPDAPSGVALAIRDADGAHAREVAELCGLLGLPAPPDGARRLSLPVRAATAKDAPAGLDIATRSVFDLVEILGASIEVPEAHARAGLPLAYPPAGPAGRDLHIGASEKKPDRALVRVQYRDTWFWIDETDQQTKEVFRLTSALWAAGIAKATQPSRSTPVLTLPASR